MSTWKKVLLVCGLVAATTFTVLGGYGSRQSIRMVDFLRIFAGGFLLGVTALGALRAMRSADKAAAPPPPNATPKSGA